MYYNYGNLRSIKLLFLLIENNETSVETKFYGRIVNINEVIELQ